MPVKVSDLGSETSPEATDILLIADPVTGVAKKITVSALAQIINESAAIAFTAAGGETTYTNSSIGSQAIVYRNGIIQENGNPGTGESYYTRATTTITFSPALSAGERIFIQSVKL